MKKTKIICTLGPSSLDEKTMREMLLAGMNVARINLSHGTKERREKMIDTFRKVRDQLNMPAAVLLDTRGPEIRVKNFKNGHEILKDGQMFTITTREVEGTNEIVSVTYKNFAKEMEIGDVVLINDGKIIINVTETTDTDVTGKVIHGGVISDHKGINLPDKDIKMEYLSKSDKEDLLFGIEKDIDYVAASFIRNVDDLIALRNFLYINGGQNIKIIAKIESTQGVKNFEEILEVADGIMIARGDMGVELAYEKLPGIQKRFIKRCVQAGKIVITATQMLESMITTPVPTRAEITDVANAVFDGTTAVMLSGETAAGDFPVESVNVMSRIAMQAEQDMRSDIRSREPVWHDMDVHDVTNAVAHGACTLAKDIDAKGIMAVTKTGYTAARISKFRPDTMIIGATPYEKAYHQMSLMWGVEPIMANYRADINELFSHFARKAIRQSILDEGDKLVITAGLPVDIRGNTNMIRVITATMDGASEK